MIDAGTARVFKLGDGLVFRVPDSWRGELRLKYGMLLHVWRPLGGQLLYSTKPSEHTQALRMREWRGSAIVTIRKQDAGRLEIKPGTVLQLEILDNGTLAAIAPSV